MTRRARWLWPGIAALLALSIASPVIAQQTLTLDEDCVVTVGNQTALVQPDGSFMLRNISIFRSRDTAIVPGLYKARVACLEEGVTTTGQSGFFELTPGQTQFVTDIFPSALDPIPTRIEATAPQAFVPFGDDLQLTVTAHFADGSMQDRTLRAQGTTYLSSNTRLLTVSDDGLVTGQNDAGLAATSLITVLHDGNIATIDLSAVGVNDDFDGDGMPNDYEDLMGLNKLVDDTAGDLDGDGLSNIDEFNLGSLPNVADTDGDGILDGVDLDPLRPEESPPVVNILSPLDGTTVNEGQLVQFEADISDDGFLTEVILSTDTGAMRSIPLAPFITTVRVPTGVSTMQFSVSATDTVPNQTVANAGVTVTADPLTTVIGRVLDTGTPVSGATVRTLGGLTDATDGLGEFSIANVATVPGDIVAAAAVDSAGTLLWGSASAAPVPGGTTDLGDIAVAALPPLRTDVGTVPRPFSIAVGDIDGDGIRDLAVHNQPLSAQPQAELFLGNGDGSFTSGLVLTTPFNTRLIEIADFNLDGIADLAVTGDTSGFNGASWVYMGRGGLTFDAPLQVNFNGAPNKSYIRDLDSDGFPDIAVAMAATFRIPVLFGNGDGTFFVPGSGSLPIAESSTNDLAIEDMDGDGFTDFIAAIPVGAQTWLSFAFGSGPRDFTCPPPVFDAGPCFRINNIGGTRANALAAGDLDGDGGGTGDLDLVVGTTTGVRVLLQTAPRVFTADATYDIGGSVRLVRVADMDANGDLDIVALGSVDTVHVLLGNGDGTFAAPVSYDTGSIPLDVEAADLNFSGLPDVVTASRDSDSVSILLGTGSGALQSPSGP